MLFADTADNGADFVIIFARNFMSDMTFLILICLRNNNNNLWTQNFLQEFAK